MFHSNTQKLISTWRAHREGARVPQRASLAPIDLGPLLPQVFMLGRTADGEESFRLSGGLVADLHGQELRGASFYDLWPKFDRPQVAGALARARSAATPVVITANAATARGDQIGLEICLAPLIGPSGEADRTIGLYQPISTVARLMGAPIRTLSVRSIDLADEPQLRTHLRLIIDNTRKVA